MGERPLEEFYDLKADPHQMNNLADSDEHQAVKQKLSKQLMDELEKYEDPRVVGEGDAFDRAPYWKPGR